MNQRRGLTEQLDPMKLFVWYQIAIDSFKITHGSFGSLKLVDSLLGGPYIGHEIRKK